MPFVFQPLAFIEGVGGPEMVMILLVVLVLFGGQKLPGFARGLGKSIREFKKAASGVEEEFKRAIEEDDRKNNIAPPAPVARIEPAPAAPALLPAETPAAPPSPAASPPKMMP